MKIIWIFLESFKRKLKLLESPERRPAGNLREKWKKKSEKFKRNIIKLIKLKNRKKKNLKFRKTRKEFKEKLRSIWQTDTQLFQSKFWDSVQEQYKLKTDFTKFEKIVAKFWKIVDDIL